MKPNAASIYKGYGHKGEGWYVRPFGLNAQYYGSSVAEALEIIQERADYQDEVRSWMA
jgi:hypothetical protein